MKKYIIFALLLSNISLANSFKVMSYNVENFFDTKHDEGKNDWSLLPKKYPLKEEYCRHNNQSGPRLEECLKANWNKYRYGLKLHNISKVIKSENPDILGLVEIENETVVSDIAKETNMDKFFVTNSPDERGIDVALLVKNNENYSVIGHRELVLNFPELAKPTRNILEVEVNVKSSAKNYSLFIYVNHWPSQNNPAISRVKTAEFLMNIIHERKNEKPESHFLLLGDFNVVDKDQPYPFKALTEGQNPLVDIHPTFMKDKTIKAEVKNALPKGTYFFSNNMEWNILDHFFATKNLLDGEGLEAKISSYNIVHHDFLSTDYKYKDRRYHNYGTVIKGVPFRCEHMANFPWTMGFTDHFAITMELFVK